MSNDEIKTPQTHPDHAVVGKWWRAWDGSIYYCDSYDPKVDYFMTSVDGEKRIDVSVRTIGRTFHPARHCENKPIPIFRGSSAKS